MTKDQEFLLEDHYHILSISCIFNKLIHIFIMDAALEIYSPHYVERLKTPRLDCIQQLKYK